MKTPLTILVVLAVAVTAAAAIALPFFIESKALWWLEGAMVLVIVLLIALQRAVVAPMTALDHGIGLLKAQDFSSRLVRTGYRPADRIGATFNAMMEQLHNERLRVIEQNHFLDTLIEASPAGIMILNFDGSTASANRAAQRALASAEVTGTIANLRRGERRIVRTNDSRIYACTRLSFLDKGHHRPFVMIEALTEEVLKAERASYGKVIRTMVHEVNNTLSGVVALMETCADASDDDSIAEAAHSCSERCTALSRFIGNFADVVKTGRPDLRPCDLNDFVLGLRPFLESLCSGRDIELRYNLDPEMKHLPIDRIQMEQVLVNIVKNAAESIGSHGVVEISTTAQPPVLTVADNGPGISEEAAGSLFAPFFSTKESGQGIGLTLSAEILRGHGFAFRLFTENALTRFEIRLGD